MPNQPTFDGRSIFGDAVEIKPRPAPADIQVSAFCGINGVDLLGLGSRGTILDCSGLLWSSSYQGLTLILDTWRAYLDVGPAGTGYTVVDTVDRTWLACVIRSPLTQIDRMLLDRADPTGMGNNNFAVSYRLEIFAPLPPILPSGP